MQESKKMTRPSRADLENIFHYVGLVLIALGLCMLVPTLISLVAGEWASALDLLISACLTVGAGNLLFFLLRPRGRVTWNQGLVIVALSWLAAMLSAALPLYLNGHYASYLDACFESMSGLATTGLTLVHDLDHMAYSMNFWRHFIMFLGGQGIVVLVVSYFMAGSSAAAQLYISEGRESILPNVVESSRFIWRVSVAYLAAGTLSLGVCLMLEGMAPVRSFFQACCLFMAGFDTGGFTPQAQSVLYYHSFPVELITMVFMVLGMLNFAVQHEFWRGKPRELAKNIETRTLITTLVVTLGLVLGGLTLAGAFGGFAADLRRGVYQLVSGHSGTGFMTVYGQQMGARWGDLALFALIVAMGLGGCSCSTSGAIKSIRVGILGKDIKQRARKALSPTSAVVVERFHHIREYVLTDELTSTAFMVTLLYLGLYLLGTVVGLFYGYGLTASAFESVSAAGNVGLTTGVTSFTMPTLLKVVYIFEMWAGRLEVLAVIAMAVFLARLFGRKR